MALNIRNVAIITKIGSSEANSAATKVATLLNKSKINVHSVLPFIIEGATPISPSELRDIKLDLVFAIGGDGTTLRAFRMIPGRVPLFSINSGGHRGILSDIDAGSIDDAVNTILAGKYFYDYRIRIQASVNGKLFPPVLNDILIIRVNLTRTPLLSVMLMGDEIKQRMDGIVISTPTGSTGHSFSVGGPVLHEGMSCLSLTPIASVNRMPQLVIPLEQILIRSTHESHMILDGQETFKVQADEPINILRCSDDAVFLRLHKKGMRQLAKLGFSRFAF
ncbi:MAG: NAD(+)/NADH kinase [Thermoproteota archaeon]|jgi:NAD+ kinase|nr:NAD(+)/NADH kinase [Thermoproteota archaeon]MDQ3977719.1 NAD(+)/NADH kinase [Thermoproteota archaeon]